MKIAGRPDVKIVLIGTIVVLGMTATYSMPIVWRMYHGIYEWNELRELALFVVVPLVLFYSQTLRISYVVTEEEIVIRSGLWRQRLPFRTIVHMQRRGADVHIISESRWFNYAVLRPQEMDRLLPLLLNYHPAAFRNGSPIE